MSSRLLLADRHAAADALTFAGRSRSLGDGAVRLRSSGGVLVMTSAPLAPRGLLDRTPTVLAMRMLPADPELECDLVVDAGALGLDETETALALPDSAVSAPWAGVSPPRGGWRVAGDIAAAVLAARAQSGIAQVARAMPADPGEEVVREVRAAVWGVPDALLGELPLGAAFAAFAMGFIVGEETARVFESGPWTRITLDRGHVLVRGPVRVGLTEVRATGAG
ncbi:hypothetical protein RZO50_10265 [Microbacterium sp. SSW1-59]|uniref:hypothetical protein n=1 Tax=Microbacterium xanthum TaxID=3079794 RepID=UPI002AD28A4C|nr:hypothetical protein [Microbacterium sp. SSW1-59]MDZ8201903.1 hypothetical protein [Microbacterium sp. SSW1-59]